MPTNPFHILLLWFLSLSETFREICERRTRRDLNEILELFHGPWFHNLHQQHFLTESGTSY